MTESTNQPRAMQPICRLILAGLVFVAVGGSVSMLAQDSIPALDKIPVHETPPIPPTPITESVTWTDLKAKFQIANPQLKADAIGIDEARAMEITAYLRPNPSFAFTMDGTQIVPNDGHFRPFAGTSYQPGLSYLHERDHKRELRLGDAKDNTLITADQHIDLERNLVFSLRGAYVQTLEAKAVLKAANDDIEYYDRIIAISREQFKDGAIAEIDLDRIELLRVQYESEQQNAVVNLRTAKIQLLQLLNERTPVDSFDVVGDFDWAPELGPLDDFHQTAIANRPDLKAALDQIEKSKVDYKLAKANGSTDPTFGAWYTYNSSTNNPYAVQTAGGNVSIPLRVFDRNQGEKKRTLLDIEKSQQSATVATAQVFNDVDSAYEQVRSNIVLLTPYKQKYVAQATRVRDTVTYAYQHGGASLMDFLNAESDYRTVQLTYLQLIGSYLTATAQLNLSVGREVIQ